LAATLAKNATKPNPFEIIPLQTTRKENNCKTEDTLAREVVTLENGSKGPFPDVYDDDEIQNLPCTFATLTLCNLKICKLRQLTYILCSAKVTSTTEHYTIWWNNHYTKTHRSAAYRPQYIHTRAPNDRWSWR
jgi:hypothetical protein